jgi:peptidoglycan hydrolase-like protein with peptidoglycan-binding domain
VRLPAEIVEIRPRFRNHYFVVVRDEIIILDNGYRIVEVIPVEAAGGSGPAVRGSSTQVVVDLSPDEIREVQLVLIERRFSIEADGILGPRTRQALIQFQRREGLQVTGQIDSRTVASLGVSVRTGQDRGGQQPSTTGQGGQSQGSGSAQQPSRSDQDARQPQRGPMNQQGDRSGAGSKSGQKPDAPTTDQGSGTTGQGQSSGANQTPPADQGGGAGQSGAGNPPAKQSPQGGANGGSGSMPRGQSK